ncbi:BBP7 family outer membrane beta-barrel protein [Rosistilla oblonga]|uniref:BBP7 family outer membrane beta-barrel protein n=1 Tax=Rosistilla oblonga TaxID=2527990 RepID=UPI003A9807CB
MVFAALLRRPLRASLALTVSMLLPLPVVAAAETEHGLAAQRASDPDAATLSAAGTSKTVGPANVNHLPTADLAASQQRVRQPIAYQSRVQRPAHFDSTSIPHLTKLDPQGLENHILSEQQLQALFAATRSRDLTAALAPAPQGLLPAVPCQASSPCPPENPHVATNPQVEATPHVAANPPVAANPYLATNAVQPNADQTATLLPSPQFGADTVPSISTVSSRRPQMIVDVPCSPRFWADAELLSIWVRGDSLPTLLTTSPLGTAAADAGQMGLPTTSSMFGGGRSDSDARLGVRFSVGRWLMRADQIAIEMDYAFLGHADATHVFSSAGNPMLARPFYDANPGVDGEAADLIAFDTLTEGQVAIDTHSELYSGGVGMRAVALRWSDPMIGRRVDWLSGFRYFRLAESVRIGDHRTATATHDSPYGSLDAGTTVDSFDLFKTENDFYGFDMGVAARQMLGRWSLQSHAKIAFGVNQQGIEMAGQRTIAPLVGAATTERGGLLTGEDNLGGTSRQRFAVIPETRIEAGYQLTAHLRASIGYQFLYLSDAVRPGAQIDRAANSTMLNSAVAAAGPSRPSQRYETEGVYVHGGTFGLELNY